MKRDLRALGQLLIGLVAVVLAGVRLSRGRRPQPSPPALLPASTREDIADAPDSPLAAGEPDPPAGAVAVVSTTPRVGGPAIPAAATRTTPPPLAAPTRLARVTELSFPAAGWPMIFGGAIVVVDAALLAPGQVFVAQLADAVLVFLLVHMSLLGMPRMSRAAQAATSALVLVPLSLIVAAGLPLRRGSVAAATLLVAALVGVLALWIGSATGLSAGLRIGSRITRTDARTVLAGVVLGLVAYLLGAPSLWPGRAGVGAAFIALIAATVAAAVEEVVFRGVIQTSFERLLKRGGALAASVLFASTYLYLRPAPLVLTMALAGMIFADAVARSGALGGAIGGHAALVLGAGAVWPELFGRHHGSPPHAIFTVLLALAIGAMGWGLLLRRSQKQSADDA